MKLHFLGAARTTTGSMHLLELGGKRILLECGLYQGKRKEAFERNRNLPVDPKTLDACILSHAHIDHSGNLPTLVKKGFSGPIFSTPATRDLCKIMLADSAYLQGLDVKYVNKKRARQGKNLFEPLYLPEDAERAVQKMTPVPYGTSKQVAAGVALTFHDAGHILGSAVVQLDLRENGTTKKLLFTGDLGRAERPILKDPVVVKNPDVLITESTYGNRVHPPRADVLAKLAGLCRNIHERRSKLVIPSFSVGRTQAVLYYINQLFDEGQVERMPVFVDSPLSTRATEVHEAHPECYDSEMQSLIRNGQNPFTFKGLTCITDVKDSKGLNAQPGPMIIISASGMCEGGRILHHLKNTITDSRNMVLIVGYQAEHTLGRRLVENIKDIKIFGERFEVRAEVHTINAFSAHADRNELKDYYARMGPAVERAFVVHGEEKGALGIADVLTRMGAKNVCIPQPGQTEVI